MKAMRPEDILAEAGWSPEEIATTHGRFCCLQISLIQLKHAIIDSMIKVGNRLLPWMRKEK
jgi:hypothetical protein